MSFWDLLGFDLGGGSDSSVSLEDGSAAGTLHVDPQGHIQNADAFGVHTGSTTYDAFGVAHHQDAHGWNVGGRSPPKGSLLQRADESSQLFSAPPDPRAPARPPQEEREAAEKPPDVCHRSTDRPPPHAVRTVLSE